MEARGKFFYDRRLSNGSTRTEEFDFNGGQVISLQGRFNRPIVSVKLVGVDDGSITLTVSKVYTIGRGSTIWFGYTNPFPIDALAFMTVEVVCDRPVFPTSYIVVEYLDLTDAENDTLPKGNFPWAPKMYYFGNGLMSSHE